MQNLGKYYNEGEERGGGRGVLQEGGEGAWTNLHLQEGGKKNRSHAEIGRNKFTGMKVERFKFIGVIGKIFRGRKNLQE